MKNILKSSLSIGLIGLSAAIVGCTAPQQDNLFENVIDMARGAANLELKTASAGDVELTYLERQGNLADKSEVLLLLHGFSANKDNWIRFTQALDEKYHVIAPDLAGHGDSDKELTTDYGLIKQAERLDALMSGLGIEKFHIAGNSMGGAISAIYSLAHPEKVKSLTLIDAAGVDGATQSEYYKALAEGSNPLIATDEESFEFRMDFTMSQPPVLPWPLRPALYRQTMARVDINQKIFSDMLATKEKLANENFAEKLTGNTIPTLIMWGDEDRVLDVSAATAFNNLIPGSKMHIFEGVGHLPMVEIPDESAEVYQQFISTVE